MTITTKRITATFSEIGRYIKSNLDPSKENFLSTIYDQCKIYTSSKKDIFRFIDSLLIQLQKELQAGKPNLKKNVIFHFLIEVISNETTKDLFVQFLNCDKKYPDLHSFVQNLENIIEPKEFTNDLIPNNKTFQDQKSEKLIGELKNEIILIRGSSLIKSKNSPKSEAESSGTRKTFINNKIQPRAFVFALEILYVDITANEGKIKKFQEYLKSNAAMDQAIKNQFNLKNYKSPKNLTSYKNLIQEAHDMNRNNKIGPLKNQLKQIINSPDIFTDKRIREKAREILNELE